MAVCYSFSLQCVCFHCKCTVSGCYSQDVVFELLNEGLAGWGCCNVPFIVPCICNFSQEMTYLWHSITAKHHSEKSHCFGKQPEFNPFVPKSSDTEHCIVAMYWILHRKHWNSSTFVSCSVPTVVNVAVTRLELNSLGYVFVASFIFNFPCLLLIIFLLDLQLNSLFC